MPTPCEPAVVTARADVGGFVEGRVILLPAGIYPGNGQTLFGPTCWHNWVNDATNCTSTGTSAVWLSWATTTNSGSGTTFAFAQPQHNVGEGQRFIIRPPTPEEAAAQVAARLRQSADQAAQQLEWRRQEAVRKTERQRATRKARVLLMRMLTQEQREEFTREAGFRVQGSQGGSYRIGKGRSGNVQELNAEGRTVATLCIHPREMVPDEDTMLAQALLVQHDEARFRRIANRTVRAGVR